MTTKPSPWPYVAWRFDMWLKGYGSYQDIDRKVERGKLVPGTTYPDKGSRNEPNREGSEA